MTSAPLTALAFGLVLVAPGAEAAVMTFDDVTGDYTPFTQSLGDIAGLDVSNVTRETFGNAAGQSPILHWTNNYSGLVDVAFAATNGQVGELGFTPDSGLAVTLTSFDFGNYSNGVSPRNAIFRVYDADWNQLWEYVVTGHTGAAVTVNIGLTLNGPAHFQWGTDWDIGVDNFTYSVAPAAVPVPASLPLLGAGIAGFAALRRRKRA